MGTEINKEQELQSLHTILEEVKQETELMHWLEEPSEAQLVQFYLNIVKSVRSYDWVLKQLKTEKV